jgi:C2 domain
MWRQVELTLIQGRNLGNTKPFIESMTNTGIVGNADPYLEPEAIDLDVSCEILLNNTPCGRTTVKKGIGSPDWHENFTFSELPPFETLQVIVWREKKLFKPTIMGSVRIALSNFRRGETVEGWFPVLNSGPVATDLHFGDIRLKIRVDECVCLPQFLVSCRPRHSQRDHIATFCVLKPPPSMCLLQTLPDIHDLPLSQHRRLIVVTF